MLRPMERRAFLISGSLVAGSLVVPGDAAAQRRVACPPCHEPAPARAEWSGTGPPVGRAPADPSAMTDEERMHVPVLTLPERVRAGRPFDLVVQIGVRPHEIHPDHRIEWIEVALDERRVLVADLSADIAYPVLRVPIVMSGSGVLSARARCTQHGVWMTRREITLA